MALSSARGKLIGVIGDEDTCVGFLLGGVGELNKNRKPNFMVVDNDTPLSEIEVKYCWVGEIFLLVTKPVLLCLC